MSSTRFLAAAAAAAGALVVDEKLESPMRVVMPKAELPDTD